MILLLTFLPLQRSEGTTPVNQLLLKSMILKYGSPESSFGTVPVRLLDPSIRSVKLVNALKIGPDNKPERKKRCTDLGITTKFLGLHRRTHKYFYILSVRTSLYIYRIPGDYNYGQTSSQTSHLILYSVPGLSFSGCMTMVVASQAHPGTGLC